MRLRRFCLTAAVLLTGAAAAGGDQRSAEEVRACSRAHLPARTLRQEVELEVHDRAGGTQSRSGRFYLKRYPDHDETRSTLRLTSPIDVKGMAYLMIDRAEGDQLFLYLPSMQRVRRITGDSAGDSLMGTDFSYADIRQLHSMSAGGEATRLAPGEIDGRAVDRVALTAAAEAETPYRRIEFAVDRATCVPLRTLFFAEGETPRKRLEADPDSLHRIDERWLATRLVMRDLRDGTHTVLTVQDTRYDEGVSDIIFNPRSFHMGAAGPSPGSDSG